MFFKEIIITIIHFVYNSKLYSNYDNVNSSFTKQMMEKILCLPKISIKDMENKVKEQRTTHKKYNYEDSYAQNQRSHNHDIKITSPFYERTQHKDRCQCRYHRLKREMQANKINDQKKQKTTHEDSRNIIEKIESKDKEAAIEVTSRSPQLKLISPSKLLQPLKNTLPIKIELENEIGNEDQNNNYLESHSKSIKKLPTRKTFKSLKYKPIMEVLDEVAMSRVDDLNQEYIQFVSHRLQNEKFKQKYLKTLFGFIKMKSNQNRLYMQNSKAYIHNSLNMLLNHYTMDKLLDFAKLSEEEINQIAYYMNCFPNKVKGILYELGRAVSQMQKTLAEIKRKRVNEEENKQNESRIYMNNTDQQFKNEDYNKNIEGMNSLDQYHYKNAMSKDSYHTEVDQNSSVIPKSGSNIHLNFNNQNGSDIEKNSHREKYSILRSSSRKLNDFMSNSSSKKDVPQNKTIPSNQQHNIRKSIRVSQNNQEILNRSIRSTVLGIVDQIQKETHFTKKKHTTKLKKHKLKSKYSEFDEKYTNVDYEKFISKRKFQNLISQVQRLDQNDVQRGQKIFKELNVDSFLDNPQKIEDIVKTFKPLFNQKSLHFFLRQVVFVRDKRYIEKLQRELDDMLHEIKKNDPRGQIMDFFEIKPEKKVPSYMNKMVKCREFKVQKDETINHIKYFEAQQQIQRHKTREQSVKMHLEQVPLLGIHFDPIDPSKSPIINHSKSPQRQFHGTRATNLPDIEDQKKILRYMKQKHQGTFNYLETQFDNLCRSLSKEHLL